MAFVFWCGLGLIFYTYVGYPICLLLTRQFATKAGFRTPPVRAITIVMAVHNEQEVIRRKLENLFSLNYPAGHYDIVVVSDGSNDKTNQIIREFVGPRLRLLELSHCGGKATALNRALELVSSDVVFFTDARQMIEPDALKLLAARFDDPQIGSVSGQLMLTKADGAIEALGLYWAMEKRIRQLESATGSVVGVTGAIYAARRSLIPALPAKTILDDVYIPMIIARSGFRVVFEPMARAWDSLPDHTSKEFRRKVRTLTGIYQLLKIAPWLLTGRNPLLWRFASHKLLRLLVPFAMILILTSNLFLAGSVFHIVLAVQISLYALGLLGCLSWRLGFLSRIANPLSAFLILNAAALRAFANFVSNKWEVWV